MHGFFIPVFFNLTIAKLWLSTALGNGEITSTFSIGVLHNSPKV